jgi:long-chain acyl-CoA synthetase
MFVTGGRRTTRGEFEDRRARAITLLRELGVGPGDCVGVALKNCAQFFEVLSAASALGAKGIPIAWRLKRDEVRYLVEDSGSKAVIYDVACAEHFDGLPGMSLPEYERRIRVAAPSADVPTRGLRFELYSSGTTGRPKAIERKLPPDFNQDQAGALLGFLRMLGVDDPAEVHMMCGPLYHSQPIGFASMAIAAGQRVVMMEGGFDAETCLQTIEREKVTWISCVPTHLIRILALPEVVQRRYDLSSLKAVLHSASPCPRDVKARAMDLLPPDTVWEIYGGTEVSMTMISPQEWRRKPGSVGRAFPPGTELRVLDADGAELPPGEVGLVYIRPPMSFRYRDAPEQNSQTWRGDLCTLGDVGYLDEDGYLFITDRIKDMIISGGANIYPAEVEAVLFNHPAVGDAAVIGVPDPHWGERVKAIVEPRAETTADDIMDFCRAHLAHYKCPTSVDFVEQLPRDPSGKLRKRELREQYWANSGRMV